MRITRKILEKQVDRLNKLTNSPIDSWSQNRNGRITANIGNFHIEGAYDNLYSLNRITSKGGSCNIIFHYMKARELHTCINAFMSGIEFGRK